ncbi:hypothetical protein IKE84_00090 [Candidatus Saccharibacteria bacterium]|nr:hypothetical protein [Candidatus Saccharibacteria bacterium]
MEYELEGVEDKKQRQRVIIITTAIAIIVLGIAAWAIIAIVGSRSPEVPATAEIAATEDATSREKTVEEQPAPVTEGVTKVTEPKKQSTTATAKETVPETGPEELLPVALVAGTAAAYISSRKLAKREA